MELGIETPKKVLIKPLRRTTTMGLFAVDKSNEFIEEGMTLITETDSERYLKATGKASAKKKKDELYPIPEDRMERHCGGSGGFDDFVERWHE